MSHEYAVYSRLFVPLTASLSGLWWKMGHFGYSHPRTCLDQRTMTYCLPNFQELLCHHSIYPLANFQVSKSVFIWKFKITVSNKNVRLLYTSFPHRHAQRFAALFLSQRKPISSDTAYHTKITHISRIALEKISHRHDHERTKVPPLLRWLCENNETIEWANQFISTPLFTTSRWYESSLPLPSEVE